MKFEICSATGCINTPQFTITAEDHETIMLCEQHNMIIHEILFMLLPEENQQQ